MSGRDAQDVWPDRDLARRRFDAAARSFGDAAFIHDEARARLLERLDFIPVEPALAIDVGCAWAAGAQQLSDRYPGARILAVDSSAAMLARACARLGAGRIHAVRGDAESLPLADSGVDLLLANLVLPWCRPDRFFGEAARVLGPDGLFLFSTFGPDTLAEIRRAWAELDDDIHVHAFVDMHDLGDLLVAAGLRNPVMDVDRVTVTYTGPEALVADLKAAGARNAAPARRHSLTAPGRWERVRQRLLENAGDGRFSVTVELIFGQARGRVKNGPAEEAVGGEFEVPLDRVIPRRDRSR